ncbi:Sortase (surface protein transpeptidase) [Anaerococcus prevotii]|uniref:Sortase family protein n=1 Tax=Anaerococcus prevotii (strain ATCC 9321 / DSM 20548 / JCM 6508 / NCTC 11806 / PC1) TaxID=525919 RepID=C7RE93_ANAPD|nr:MULTISPECIES: class C sortase [Anaerococcus]ACV29506.1 sortase family protein [Anaerococcus prevotii DSM 20548]MCI5971866.1 class C sortase [Anaerococcus sp.]SUU95180.1 Sortase (surface protein transpeptidase) [Anaerococcus prevotii]
MKTKLKDKIKFGLIFLVGLLIFSYPMISQKFYEIKAEDEIIEFVKQSKEINEEEVNKRMELARAYNETLDPSRLSDPYSKKEEEARAYYAHMLEVNEMIGHVEIPKINQDLPVYAGTSETVLQKGCGHLEGTSLPVGGKSTHTVITAHRGLPEAVLFRYLDQLVEGDIFYFHNIQGTLAYRVDQIMVVEPTNFEPVLVQEGKDYATLLTCTPYMINSHRLLVRGYRIPYQEAIDDGIANTPRFKPDFFQLLLILMPILVFLIIVSTREKRKSLNLRKEVEDIEKTIKTNKN